MTDDQPSQTPQQAAEDLTEGMRTLSSRLDTATRYSRRSRVMIWVTIVSLVLDVALTVVLAVVAVQADHASHDAARASASSLALCQAGNTSRKQQSDIWNYFLHVVGKPKSPAAIHAEALLRARLRVDFSPRNCPSLGRPRP